MTPAEGDAVTPYDVTLTLQRLVMEAAASRDFATIHFDPEAARASGAKDVYANTTFIETILEAAIRSWAGPAARLRMLEFAMKDFNCAGDVITAGGMVNRVRHTDVDADLWIDGPRGRTVTGSATVRFPE
jgi:acyl dehydratase